MDEEVKFTLYSPKPSAWRCSLFGHTNNGVAYIPSEGQVPNWFHRKMQTLVLGFKWEKAGG